MSQPMIAVKNLNKHFDQHHVLQDIGFSVDAGEMVALLGPSGSGKSTLLRHLNGLMPADKSQASEIRLIGLPVQQNGRFGSKVRQCRSQTGYIFQQFNLVSRLSVLQNVLIGALNHTPLWRSLSGRFNRAQQQALAALDRVGLVHLAQQRVSTLSGGQQQRVAIARALMQQAKVILADEPIASLDPESSRVVMDLLQTINQQEGITVLVSLHQVDYATQYCPRVIALKQGKVFYDGASATLTEHTLSQLYSTSTAAKQSVTCTPASLLAQTA